MRQAGDASTAGSRRPRKASSGRCGGASVGTGTAGPNTPGTRKEFMPIPSIRSCSAVDCPASTRCSCPVATARSRPWTTTSVSSMTAPRGAGTSPREMDSVRVMGTRRAPGGKNGAGRGGAGGGGGVAEPVVFVLAAGVGAGQLGGEDAQAADEVVDQVPDVPAGAGGRCAPLGRGDAGNEGAGGGQRGLERVDDVGGGDRCGGRRAGGGTGRGAAPWWTSATVTAPRGMSGWSRLCQASAGTAVGPLVWPGAVAACSPIGRPVRRSRKSP